MLSRNPLATLIFEVQHGSALALNAIAVIAQGGDQLAMTVLYQAVHGRLRDFLFNQERAGGWTYHEAEDIAHRGLTRALTRLVRWDAGRGRFFSWLCEIVRKEALSYAREQHAAGRDVARRATLDEAWMAPVAGPEAAYEAKELLERFRASLSTRSARLALADLERFGEGATLPQVSRLTGVKRSALAMRRARLYEDARRFADQEWAV